MQLIDRCLYGTPRSRASMAGLKGFARARLFVLRLQRHFRDDLAELILPAGAGGIARFRKSEAYNSTFRKRSPTKRCSNSPDRRGLQVSWRTAWVTRSGRICGMAGFVAATWAVLTVALWTAPAYAQNGGPKKLIYYGWGVRDTQYVRDHWREMEQIPFDGTGIVVVVDRQAWLQGKTDTGNQLGWLVMGTRLFRIEEFREAIADLRAAKWRTFTDNFLPVALSQSGPATGLNWFDDARWRVITENFRVVAQIAAAGDVKGLILDPEHYGYALFRYSDQRRQLDRPFADYTKAARQRGREVMASVAAHLPRAVLLSFYAYTLPLSELEGARRLEDTVYGLLPAFYDGLLEAMPAGASLVDGYETAYAFKERRQFIDAYRRIREGAIKLSALPDRYRAQVRAGFGLRLDYGGKLEHFTPPEFRQAVATALAISDGYVWIYSEGPRFFPVAGIELPYVEALTQAREAIKR
jgi:hypothetical protein